MKNSPLFEQMVKVVINGIITTLLCNYARVNGAMSVGGNLQYEYYGYLGNSINTIARFTRVDADVYLCGDLDVL